MQTARVGRSGLTVSRLCLGSMYFGGTTSADEAIQLMAAALEHGIDFWDTSNMYNHGRAEEIVGRGLSELGARERVVLATKVFYPMVDGLNNQGGGRRHIIQELDAQLRRLRTDWIDLYYLHRADFGTPLDETIATLDDCVRGGKIRYWGTSTFPAWRIAEAWWRAERRGWDGPICEQAPYNLLDRRVENDRLACLREYGLGLMTWSSLAGGLLSGKYDTAAIQAPPPGTRLADLQERYSTRVGRPGLVKARAVAELAREAGLDPVRFAIAWVLRQDAVTATVIGPRTVSQLDGYIDATEAVLDDTLLEAVDGVVAPGTAYADFHDTSGWYVGALNG